ncbi:MAG: hypothetical protein ACT443_09915 [Gemmatimonadota bacterium]
MPRSNRDDEARRRAARVDARASAREYMVRDARADLREYVAPRRKSRRELKREEERCERGED